MGDTRRQPDAGLARAALERIPRRHLAAAGRRESVSRGPKSIAVPTFRRGPSGARVGGLVGSGNATSVRDLGCA